jgi:alkanesulfonate monooxygenase SsuD/methylene tetrahydromethanopterin reductase-like flavin-dependent oxidoreductase (luciferase family)
MTAALTFGFLYDLRNPEPWRKRWTDLYAETLEFIPWTESLGYTAAWMPEHHVAEDGYLPSPLIMLAAIAARTKTITIGSAVALAPFYHPVRFAEDCALLDVISNGRLEIALALGYRRRETDAYGIDFRTRASRMNQFLDIVGRLWAGESVTCEGPHFTLKNASILPRPTRRIPLLLGGFADKALERVAKYADGYMGLPEAYDLYAEKLRACGKNPADMRFYLPSFHLIVDRDPEAALHEVAPFYHLVNNSYGEWLNEDRYDAHIGIENIPRAMSLGEFKASGLLKVLTPAQAIDMFRALRAKVPVDHIAMTVPAGMPLSRFARHAELFASEVMPALR